MYYHPPLNVLQKPTHSLDVYLEIQEWNTTLAKTCYNQARDARSMTFTYD